MQMLQQNNCCQIDDGAQDYLCVRQAQFVIEGMIKKEKHPLPKSGQSRAKIENQLVKKKHVNIQCQWLNIATVRKK